MNEASVLDVQLGEVGSVVLPSVCSLGLLVQRVGNMQRGGGEQGVGTALGYGDGGGDVDEGDMAVGVLEEERGGRLHVAAPEGAVRSVELAGSGRFLVSRKKRGSVFVGKACSSRP